MPNEDIDPLDAARVMQPGTGDVERRPKQRAKPEVAVIQVAPPTPAADPVFRVVKAARISWGQQMIKLKEGQLIGESSYGTGVIQRFRDLGVELEQVG